MKITFEGWKGKGGKNFAGQIYEQIRDNNLPRFMCVGDEMLSEMALPNELAACAIVGGNLQTICKIAFFISNIGTDGVLIHAGIHDLIDSKNENKQNVVHVIILVCIYVPPNLHMYLTRL